MPYTGQYTDKTHQCLATFLSGHRRNAGTLLSVSSGVQQLTVSIMLPELMVSETFRSIEHVSLCWSAKWSNQAQDCSQVVKPFKPARLDYNADDLVIFAPSHVGLFMLFCCKKFKDIHVPRFELILPRINQCKYLGYVITDDLKDDNDIARQYNIIYAKGNALIRKFFICVPIM